MNRNIFIFGALIFFVFFATMVAAEQTQKSERATSQEDKGGIVEGVGGVAATGAKTVVVDVPNAVGGGASFGFDFIGKILDGLGEKKPKEDKEETAKLAEAPKEKPKPDPMTTQQYPGQRQF